MYLTLEEVIAIVKSTPGVKDCTVDNNSDIIEVYIRMRWWAPRILNARKVFLHLNYILESRRVSVPVNIRLYSWRGKLLEN